jgi:hypothetical protein
MPAWSNTDAPNAKPKFDYLRQTREILQFTVRTGNTAGNNIIQVSYNDGGLNNVANVGVQTGQYVYFWANGFGVSGGQAGNGVPGFFQSNTTVSGISGNNVILGNNLFNNVSAGSGVEFDNRIAYTAGEYLASTNPDTILITPTRIANSQSTYGVTGSQANVVAGITTAQVGSMNAGWNLIRKKTNADGTVRYLKETLVALANPVASNVYSGNTSVGGFVKGV